MYIYIYMYKCIYIYTHVRQYVHVRMFVYIYVHVQMCIPTHTYTQADARKLLQTCRSNFGLVRAIIEVPASTNGSAWRIWTAHSDGRVRIWDPQNVVQVDEINLNVPAAARAAVLCLLYYARQDGEGGEVWAGTAAAQIWRISLRAHYSPLQSEASTASNHVIDTGGYTVVEMERPHLKHQGALRCMLRVGDDVWTGSYSGEIFVWDALHADKAASSTEPSADRMLQRGHGAVKAMAMLHSDLVLTGHRSGAVQIWTIEGIRQSWASGNASVKCAVEAGGLAWTGHAGMCMCIV